MLAPWKKSYDQPRQHIKKQRHYLANKGWSSQSYGFSSSHVSMWEVDHKEDWEPRYSCFWTMVVEKTIESTLDCNEIKAVNPKGNQSWIFIRRTDAEAETPILWPPDAKIWLIEKDPDVEKNWKQEEKGWHRMRWLDGITNSMDMSFSKPWRWWRTGKPAVRSPCGHKVSDRTEWMNNKLSKNSSGGKSLLYCNRWQLCLFPYNICHSFKIQYSVYFLNNYFISKYESIRIHKIIFQIWLCTSSPGLSMLLCSLLQKIWHHWLNEHEFLS